MQTLRKRGYGEKEIVEHNCNVIDSSKRIIIGHEQSVLKKVEFCIQVDILQRILSNEAIVFI